MTHLLIVESPAKAKTIQKYLGKDYEVLASYGHVRDLPAKKGSVNPEDGFAMTYAHIAKNDRHIKAIADALKNADELLLATDPDREGEAISWHIQEIMQEKKLLKNKPVRRVVFNEITKSAIIEAIENPRDISMNLVNAQQARRALDYLVGFNLSPLLWKKVRKGLSAGRVQSPALRLIVEREEEIERFESQEYWKVLANCTHEGMTFDARLTNYQNEKVQQFTFNNETQVNDVKNTLVSALDAKLTVQNIEKKQRKRKTAPPFITSTLQQESARKLGFTARKTMMIAQQLYEGIDIGTGTVGLISYMRTDSVSLSKDAIAEIRQYIGERFGQDYLPSQEKVYKTKSKNAQEAHEAIRPTSILRQPDTLQKSLSPDQFKLYQLIWQRTLASQMEDALVDTLTVDFTPEDKQYQFRTTGATIAFPGFLSVYEEGKDDNKDDDEAVAKLPAFSVGQTISVNDIVCTQHFTEPPPRYSEATLVKSLEAHDIGRPSTYATIIHTLQLREYVVVEKKRFSPTDVGRIVNKFLTNHFTQYVDYAFTAGLEDKLDEIARGENEWVPILKEFWQPFITQVESIDASVKRKDVTTESLDENCPKCQKPLAIRLGKRGRFIGCTGYPECDFTQALNQQESEPTTPTVVEGRTCPLCQHELYIKAGKYGQFIGCSQYPTCNHMEPLNKPADTGISCPICHNSTLLQRKSRFGKIFFSCGDYPKCKYALWHEPIDKPCPKCAWPVMMKKVTKRKGEEHICPKEGCGHSEPV